MCNSPTYSTAAAQHKPTTSTEATKKKTAVEMNFANNWIILSAFIALSSSIETRKFSRRPDYLYSLRRLFSTLCARVSYIFSISFHISQVHMHLHELMYVFVRIYVRSQFLRVQIFSISTASSNRWDCICSLSLLAAALTVFFLLFQRKKNKKKHKKIYIFTRCYYCAAVWRLAIR